MENRVVPFLVDQKISFGGRRSWWGLGPKIYPDIPEALIPVPESIQRLCGAWKIGHIRQVDRFTLELEIQALTEPVGGRARLSVCVPSPPELWCRLERLALSGDTFTAKMQLHPDIGYSPSEWHGDLLIGFELLTAPIHFVYDAAKATWTAHRSGHIVGQRVSQDQKNPPQHWEYTILRDWDPARAGKKFGSYCDVCGSSSEEHILALHQLNQPNFCNVCGSVLPHNQYLRVA